jgi:magnesium-transporting ATPase (P-type)
VVKGVSSVDESMLTGESIPVTKQPNDFVFGSIFDHPLREFCFFVRGNKFKVVTDNSIMIDRRYFE